MAPKLKQDFKKVETNSLTDTSITTVTETEPLKLIETVAQPIKHVQIEEPMVEKGT